MLQTAAIINIITTTTTIINRHDHHCVTAME